MGTREEHAKKGWREMRGRGNGEKGRGERMGSSITAGGQVYSEFLENYIEEAFQKHLFNVS